MHPQSRNLKPGPTIGTFPTCVGEICQSDRTSQPHQLPQGSSALTPSPAETAPKEDWHF
ncbi:MULTISPECIES: hypothetical protein [unclassified Microcoleus]|nr:MULTISPECIES: hypothetical protein [unclassified Microcoleus]MCC3412579.1 hypothetical protein [Microcoleus sp. PH2017_02_FOX_O_A]